MITIECPTDDAFVPSSFHANGVWDGTGGIGGTYQAKCWVTEGVNASTPCFGPTTQVGTGFTWVVEVSTNPLSLSDNDALILHVEIVDAKGTFVDGPAVVDLAYDSKAADPCAPA